MRTIIALLLVSSLFVNAANAQSAGKAAYVEIGGPGLLSANYDMRFAHTQNGAGFRLGVGAFSVDGISVLTVPVGLNYLIGKHNSFFEVGAGFTYVHLSTSNKGKSKNFKSSFGNVNLGYRYAPAKGGLFFQIELTPVFGSGFFIPYLPGLGLGYKF